MRLFAFAIDEEDETAKVSLVVVVGVGIYGSNMVKFIFLFVVNMF